MASPFRRLRGKKTNTTNEEQTKTVTEDRLIVEAGVNSSPQRVESERAASVSEDGSELTSWEYQFLNRVSRGYVFFKKIKFQHIFKFVVFVVVCWLVGLSVRNYFSPQTEVFWFLKQLNLLDYYSELGAYGFENMEDIVWATDQDLLEAGVKLRAHRIRILANTHKLKNSFPVFLCFICTLLICQSLIVSAFLLCLVCHEGFRQKTSAVLLWSSITLWYCHLHLSCVQLVWCRGRYRKYQRYLREQDDLRGPHRNEMRDSTINGM